MGRRQRLECSILYCAKQVCLGVNQNRSEAERLPEMIARSRISTEMSTSLNKIEVDMCRFKRLKCRHQR